MKKRSFYKVVFLIASFIALSHPSLMAWGNGDPSGTVESDRKLRSRDKLRIRIFNSTCNQIVEVDDRGMVRICFVETEILAAGKTLNSLKKEILLRLKERLKDPEVEVLLI